MNLTEPQAGTDVGALKTRAVPNGDHYLIQGPTSSPCYAVLDVGAAGRDRQMLGQHDGKHKCRPPEVRTTGCRRHEKWRGLGPASHLQAENGFRGGCHLHGSEGHES